jgi:hypothetical protein
VCQHECSWECEIETTDLIVNVGTSNGDTGGRTNIESIGVVALVLAITSGVVDSDAIKSKLLGAVDGEDLNGRILDLDVLDLRVGHLVGVEELGLGLATVGTLAIPPSTALAVDDGARSTDDGDVVSRDRNERTSPLLVTKGGRTLEGDGGTSSQAGQIKGGSSRDNGTVDDDARARLLLLENVGSGGGSRESTTATLLKGGSSVGCTADESGDSEARELNHGCFLVEDTKEVKSVKTRPARELDRYEKGSVGDERDATIVEGKTALLITFCVPALLDYMSMC